MNMIYKIENTVTGDFYIGSSSIYKQRKAWHQSALRHNRHTNQYLQNVWNKYGEDSFQFIILEECEENQYNREFYWIDELNPKYNLNRYAKGTSYWKGKSRPKETIDKISKSLKGNSCRYGTSKYGAIRRISDNKIFNHIGEVADAYPHIKRNQVNSKVIRSCKKGGRGIGEYWEFVLQDQIKSSELLENPEEDNQQPS